MLDRQRRRRGRERDDARDDVPAAQNAILTLQRTAGNRAVQRLVHDRRGQKSKLKVPPEYANQVIAWDGTEIPDRPTPEQKQPFIVHARQPGFVEAVKKGLWIHTALDEIAESTRLTPESRGHLTADPLGGVTAERQADIRQRLERQLVEAAESHHRLLTLPKKPFVSVGQVEQAIRPVLAPDDYLPEASDLPSADTKLTETLIPGKDVKYITYACVLIALLKDDGGVERAKQLTRKHLKGKDFPSDVLEGTQVLHAYYRVKNVEYDQRSSAERLMHEDWKYKLLWTGSSDWRELYKEVSLKPGKYIIDIEGHTVMTEVLTEVTRGTPTGDVSKVFKHHSEKANYTLNHWDKKVKAIWKK